MGALRTINHPGIEVREYDLSDYVATVGGTTSLVIGFSPQGQSGVPVVPTSTTSVKSYFGTPKTEAERYFFYACKEVFDKGGNLIAARIPYNNNSQYLTPAVKYDIETWQTTHIDSYEPKYAVEEVKQTGTNIPTFVSSIGLSIPKDELVTFTDDGAQIEPTISAFDVYIDQKKTSVYAVRSYFTKAMAVSASSVGVTADVKDNVTFTALSSPETIIVKYTVPEGESVGSWAVSGDTTPSFTYSEYVDIGGTPSDGDTVTISFKRNEVDCGEYCSPQGFYRLVPDEGVSLSDALSTGAFANAWWQDDALYYFDTECTVETPVSSSTSAGLVGDTLAAPATGSTSGYAVGTELTDSILADLNTKTVTTYVDDMLGIVKGCVYNAVKKSPVLTTVTMYGSSKNDTVVGVKSYYVDGDGDNYPSCIPEDFIEYKLTTEGENVLRNAIGAPSGGSGKYSPEEIIENVNYLSSLGLFELVDHKFVAEMSTKEVKLSDSFKGAPVTADVTSGDPMSARLAIPAIAEGSTWAEVSSNYPELMVADPYEDGNYRYVAKTIPGFTDGDTVVAQYQYDPNDFYEFVSPFTSIRSVAEAGSQNYQWIHWKISPTSASTSSAAESAYVDNGILMAATAGMPLSAVPGGLSDIENVVSIKPNADHFGFIPLSAYQDYRDGAAVPAANSIVICNITEKQFGADDYNNAGMECLGIMPVLVGGLQAVPKQQIVQLPEGTGNGRVFNAVEAVVRGSLYDIGIPESEGIDIKYAELSEDGFYKPLASEGGFAPYDSTVSNDMLGCVPTIQLNAELNPDGQQKNAVTLVVCELAVSKSFDNKVYVNVLEKWTGSLDRNAVDAQNRSLFIDNIVNSEDSGSSYVRMFTNFDYATAFRSYSKHTAPKAEYVLEQNSDNTATLVAPASLGSDLWFTKPKESMSLGFTSEQTRKYIAYSTIAATLESIFDTLSNVDETTIDVVVDAGLSTIANRIKRLCDDDPDLLKAEYAPFWERIRDVDSIAGWKSICAKYITFCSSTRKDCMAVVDAPRNLSVYNDVKLVKNPKYSIDFDIMPSLTYLAGLNSSYCAQYANWVSYVDDFSGKTVWMPPSIMANGAIIYTDYNAQYFDAPAGTRRGLVTAGIDVSFNPNGRQQDNLYGKSWNYCISTTADGIVLWGQKTSQTRPSAFDRINVRRLFLRLERLTRNAMKAFIFEGNTEKLRNRVVDRLTPIFENCKTNGGLYDYQVICDTRNNTPTSIDNNELRVAVLLKPTKTAEFIILDFYALSTGMDFAEVYSYL